MNLTLDAGDFDLYDWNTDQVSQQIKVSTPGLYKVVVTDQYGCPAEDSMRVTLSESPRLEIGSDTTICLRQVIQLGPEDQADIINYSWNTGSAERIIETENEGWYLLTITDKLGCIGKDSVYVTVDPEALPDLIYIPNAFTPNGDNLNDLFPYSQRVIQPGYYIMIYSRWGEKVFDSRESENGNWDGFYKGVRVPTETFIYYVEYFGCDGVKRSIKGTVNPLY